MSHLPLIKPVRKSNTSIFNKLMNPSGLEHILPPVLCQIVLLYAEGYPEIRRVLPRLLEEISSPHYVIVYTVLMHPFSIIPNYGASRMNRYEVVEDMEDTLSHNAHIGAMQNYAYSEEVKDMVLYKPYSTKIVVFRPQRLDGKHWDVFFPLN